MASSKPKSLSEEEIRQKFFTTLLGFKKDDRVKYKQPYYGMIADKVNKRIYYGKKTRWVYGTVLYSEVTANGTVIVRLLPDGWRWPTTLSIDALTRCRKYARKR